MDKNNLTRCKEVWISMQLVLIVTLMSKHAYLYCLPVGLQSGSLSTIDSLLSRFSMWHFPHWSLDKFLIENLDNLEVYLVPNQPVIKSRRKDRAFKRHLFVQVWWKLGGSDWQRNFSREWRDAIQQEHKHGRRTDLFLWPEYQPSRASPVMWADLDKQTLTSVHW